jgi:sugar phosphate isomerase/epimerase
MATRFDRRDFLKSAAVVGVAAGMTHGGLSSVMAAPAAAGAPHAEKLGWRLGCQAYSFNRFTFFEAVDKTASVGLKWIEAYPGQRVSKDTDEKVGPGMSADAKKAVKQKLADAGVTLINFGVTGADKSTFDFAKEMGIQTIVSEPDPNQLDAIDKLCEEYGINVALHNHPKPSRYWDPAFVLECLKDRSKRIGACADTGHWLRSGLEPIDGLKLLKGRIISFHFKDLNKKGQGAHDVPWGTGVADVKGLLTEILAQGFKGVFSIEYEHNWDNSLPEIALSVAHFDKVAAELSAK